MLKNTLANRRSLLFILGFLLLVVGFNFIRPALNEHKLTTTQITKIANTPQLPEEITAEGVIALNGDNTPYLLINADDPYPQALSESGSLRLIYYTQTPSFRSAQKLVNKDRQHISKGITDSMKLNSQRLTGSPLEWQRLGLSFIKTPFPTQPLQMKPRQLSEAIKDNVDLQLIDIRSVTPGLGEVPSFPQALHWMPHEVLNNLPKLSKEKWIVLIGYSNADTQPIAFELFQRGYLLTSFLDGGYSAWAAEVDR